jgi:hypothetical protein
MKTHAKQSIGLDHLNLTPEKMRDLAGLLNQHAARIEAELIPLLHPEPEIIPFQFYHEPEAA